MAFEREVEIKADMLAGKGIGPLTQLRQFAEKNKNFTELLAIQKALNMAKAGVNSLDLGQQVNQNSIANKKVGELVSRSQNDVVSGVAGILKTNREKNARKRTRGQTKMALAAGGLLPLPRPAMQKMSSGGILGYQKGGSITQAEVDEYNKKRKKGMKEITLEDVENMPLYEVVSKFGRNPDAPFASSTKSDSPRMKQNRPDPAEGSTPAGPTAGITAVDPTAADPTPAGPTAGITAVDPTAADPTAADPTPADPTAADPLTGAIAAAQTDIAVPTRADLTDEDKTLVTGRLGKDYMQDLLARTDQDAAKEAETVRKQSIEEQKTNPFFERRQQNIAGLAGLTKKTEEEKRLDKMRALRGTYSTLGRNMQKLVKQGREDQYERALKRAELDDTAMQRYSENVAAAGQLGVQVYDTIVKDQAAAVAGYLTATKADIDAAQAQLDLIFSANQAGAANNLKKLDLRIKKALQEAVDKQTATTGLLEQFKDITKAKGQLQAQLVQSMDAQTRKAFEKQRIGADPLTDDESAKIDAFESSLKDVLSSYEEFSTLVKSLLEGKGVNIPTGAGSISNTLSPVSASYGDPI